MSISSEVARHIIRGTDISLSLASFLQFHEVLRLSVLVSVAVLCCTWQAAGSESNHGVPPLQSVGTCNNRCVDHQLPSGKETFLQLDRNRCSCMFMLYFANLHILHGFSCFCLIWPFGILAASLSAGPARWLSSNTSSTSWGKASPISWRCRWLGTMDECCVVLQKLRMS